MKRSITPEGLSHEVSTSFKRKNISPPSKRRFQGGLISNPLVEQINKIRSTARRPDNMLSWESLIRLDNETIYELWFEHYMKAKATSNILLSRIQNSILDTSVESMNWRRGSTIANQESIKHEFTSWLGYRDQVSQVSVLSSPMTIVNASRGQSHFCTDLERSGGAATRNKGQASSTISMDGLSTMNGLKSITGTHIETLLRAPMVYSTPKSHLTVSSPSSTNSEDILPLPYTMSPSVITIVPDTPPAPTTTRSVSGTSSSTTSSPKKQLRPIQEEDSLAFLTQSSHKSTINQTKFTGKRIKEFFNLPWQAREELTGRRNDEQWDKYVEGSDEMWEKYCDEKKGWYRTPTP